MKIIRYLKKPQKIVTKRRQDEKNLKIAFLSLIIFLLLTLIYFIPRSVPTNKIFIQQGSAILNNKIKQELISKGYKLLSSDSNNQEANLYFQIPQQMDDVIVKNQVKSILNKNNLNLKKITSLSGKKGLTVYVDHQNSPIGSISLLRDMDYSKYIIRKKAKKEMPKLAIIIDDFGNSNNSTLYNLINIDADITISVIPGHRFSRWAASEAVKAGKEVMLHMPMQPENPRLAKGEESFILHKDLDSLRIIGRIEAALAELPQVIGMNNHMGSLATSNQKLMKIILSNLKKKGLYFIDSLTSPRSVAYEIARQLEIPTAVRTVFLDNNREKTEILMQFEKAVKVARLSGKAIAIGHVYPETLNALKTIISQKEHLGISIVFASEIVI